MAVIYCFPNLNYRTYEPLAQRFTKAYVDNPSIAPHDLYVCVNGGGDITPRQKKLFSPLEPKFFNHTNAGKDIGSYVVAAHSFPCDLLVCLGAPARPNMPGWLDFIVRSVEENGPGMYAPWGFHSPQPHLRTTIFWITPELLKAYPHPITNDLRYSFEHGNESITMFTKKQGFAVMQVTAKGMFAIDQFHYVEKEDCLLLDQFCDKMGW